MRYIIFIILSIICFGIKAASFDADNLSYAVGEDGLSVTLLGFSQNEDSAENLIIPATVVNNGCNYKVTCIGESSFSNNSIIRTVTIPNSVLEIETNAFVNCSNLIKVSLPESMHYINDCAFMGTGITEIVLPKNLTTIEQGLFCNCKSLKNIAIPSSVECIENMAFYNCENLESVILSPNITYLGPDCFKGTKWFDNQPEGIVYVENSCLGFNGDAPEGEIIIKEGTKSLAAAAFLNCEKITKIILPDEIVNIGERTFCGCTNLKSIQLPASLEEIEYRAFKDCVQLQNIEIPHNVIEIEYETFKNCSSLKSVTLPQSLQNIGTYCFAWCDSLTNVDIPNNLKSIPDYLFFNCLQLKRVTLGEKVETIGFRAFSGCNSLSEVVALPALPPILYEDKIHLPEKVFSNYQNCNLFVPKGSSDLYKNASGWSEFANMYELADGGIDVPQNNEVYISLHNKTIQISGDVIGYIYLYAIDGKTMYIGNAKQIKLTRSGIYILKVNSKNYKILVK